MSILQKIVRQSEEIWQACLSHPFLQELGQGTLPMEKFKGYIIDDSLYLREYARVFGWGILKARTMEEMKIFWEFMSFINETESCTRLQYLKRFGITQQEVEGLALRGQNRLYCDFMLEAAQKGGAAELMMAVLPCMFSYYWLVEQLLEQYPAAADGPYADFLQDYSGLAYLDACRSWGTFTEGLLVGKSEEEQSRLSAIFRQSCLHELHFWEMSYEVRT